MLILIIEKRVNLIRLLQKLESLYQNTVNKFDIIHYITKSMYCQWIFKGNSTNKYAIQCFYIDDIPNKFPRIKLRGRISEYGVAHYALYLQECENEITQIL